MLSSQDYAMRKTLPDARSLIQKVSCVGSVNDAIKENRMIFLITHGKCSEYTICRMQVIRLTGTI